MKSLVSAAFVLVWAGLALGGQASQATGRVVAFRSAMVNAKAIGNISKVLVEEGQKVEEGQILAQLDDRVAEAQYRVALLDAQDTTALESAKLELARRQKNLERARKATLSYTELELDEAEYAVNSADILVKNKEQDLKRLEAVRALREAQLEDYKVRSPFAGVVAQEFVEVGETTAPVERALFQVIDTSKVYIEVKPEIGLLAQLAVGDAAVVEAALFPGKKFEGKITFIAPSADAAGGGGYFLLKVLVDNSEGLLRPEMLVRVTFPPKEAGEGTGEGASTEPAAAGTAQ